MFENVDLFLASFAHSILAKLMIRLENFVNILFFDCRIGEVYFNELEKRICRLLVQEEKKASKTLYFGREKQNLFREKSGNFVAD